MGFIKPEIECASLSRKSPNLSTIPDGYDYRQSTAQAFYFLEAISGINNGDWILAYNGDEVIGARQWQGSIIDVPAMGDDGNEYSAGYMQSGGTPQFKLLQDGELIDLEGGVPAWYDNGLFMVSSLTEAITVPEAFSLDRAYPNPFNPTTTISFGLPENINVILNVYDINGRTIRNIIDNINMDSGYHSVIWNADSQSSGVYFVKLHAGSYVKTQKIMLLK